MILWELRSLDHSNLSTSDAVEPIPQVVVHLIEVRSVDGGDGLVQHFDGGGVFTHPLLQVFKGDGALRVLVIEVFVSGQFTAASGGRGSLLGQIACGLRGRQTAGQQCQNQRQ